MNHPDRQLQAPTPPEDSVFARRVTIFAGHFGSGKTEFAVNGAIALARRGLPVTLVDLDIVKPYFRSRSARAHLIRQGVGIVVPDGEREYADLPIVLPEIRALLRSSDCKVLLDVGGDPTGARVLGSLADVISAAETAHLHVLNFRRPFTGGVAEAVRMVRDIEGVARLPISGIISNTHLMDETTADVVIDGYEKAEAVGRELGVPVLAVAVDEATRPLVGHHGFSCPLVTMRRLIRPVFEARFSARRPGPLSGPD